MSVGNVSYGMSTYFIYIYIQMRTQLLFSFLITHILILYFKIIKWQYIFVGQIVIILILNKSNNSKNMGHIKYYSINEYYII